MFKSTDTQNRVILTLEALYDLRLEFAFIDEGIMTEDKSQRS
jgi:hypothetical protein